MFQHVIASRPAPIANSLISNKLESRSAVNLDLCNSNFRNYHRLLENKTPRVRATLLKNYHFQSILTGNFVIGRTCPTLHICLSLGATVKWILPPNGLSSKNKENGARL
jgi:hypothetical protein